MSALVAADRVEALQVVIEIGENDLLAELLDRAARIALEDVLGDLELPLGYFHENESELQYDNNVTGGFSGAPVLAVEPKLVSNLGEFFKPARLNLIGLHLGLKNSMGFGIPATKILEFLN